MVYHDMASYLWVKGQTYYFNRRVPKDVQAHYKASRIVICLKTSRKDQAIRAARSIAQRLEDYWMSLRLANLDIPAFHLLRDKPQKLYQSSFMTLLEALELYLRLKGVNKDKVFRRGAERNIQSVVDVLSDRPLDEYSSSSIAATASATFFMTSSFTNLFPPKITFQVSCFILLKPYVFRQNIRHWSTFK